MLQAGAKWRGGTVARDTVIAWPSQNIGRGLRISIFCESCPMEGVPNQTNQTEGGTNLVNFQNLQENFPIYFW